MTFDLHTTSDFDRALRKLAKKNPEFRKAIEKKTLQILKNPFRFKPMHSPLQGFRRVHLMKSFVLLYQVDEKKKAVVLVRLEHHDSVYK